MRLQIVAKFIFNRFQLAFNDGDDEDGFVCSCHQATDQIVRDRTYTCRHFGITLEIWKFFKCKLIEEWILLKRN